MEDHRQQRQGNSNNDGVGGGGSGGIGCVEQQQQQQQQRLQQLKLVVIENETVRLRETFTKLLLSSEEGVALPGGEEEPPPPSEQQQQQQQQRLLLEEAVCQYFENIFDNIHTNPTTTTTTTAPSPHHDDDVTDVTNEIMKGLASILSEFSESVPLEPTSILHSIIYNSVIGLLLSRSKDKESVLDDNIDFLRQGTRILLRILPPFFNTIMVAIEQQQQLLTSQVLDTLMGVLKQQQQRDVHNPNRNKSTNNSNNNGSEELILPVLECLSSLRLPNTNHNQVTDHNNIIEEENEIVDIREEVFSLALKALSSVTERDLPKVIQVLLSNVMYVEEAHLAFIAIRNEFHILQSQDRGEDECSVSSRSTTTSRSICSIGDGSNNRSMTTTYAAAKVIHESFNNNNNDNGELLIQSYLNQRLDPFEYNNNNRQQKQQPAVGAAIIVTSTTKQEEDESDLVLLLLLDLILLLMISSSQYGYDNHDNNTNNNNNSNAHQQQYSDAVDDIIDNWLSSSSSSSSSSAIRNDNVNILLQQLVQCYCGDCDEEGSSGQLIPAADALIRFAMFLLLSPARLCCATTTAKKKMNDTIIISESDPGDESNDNVAVSHRTSLQKEQQQHIQEFVLALHRNLNDKDSQTELVRSLLRLSEETASIISLSASADHSSNQQAIVLRSIHTILLELATGGGETQMSSSSVSVPQQQQLPTSLLRSKHILIDRLLLTQTPAAAVTKSINDTEESIRYICRILARLLVANGGIQSSEALRILQKLLFSSTAGFPPSSFHHHNNNNSPSSIERGLILATEFVNSSSGRRRITAPCSSSSLASKDRDCIKEWVLCILVPATRRMIEPEIGRRGLKFLSAWMKEEEEEEDLTTATTGSPSKVVFQRFKILLSNTGLIQVLQQYTKNKNEDDGTVLAYADPGISSSELLVQNQGMIATATKPPPSPRQHREMIFCVHYFLSRTDLRCPSRWMSTIRWVYELLDTYLRLGRRCPSISAAATTTTTKKKKKKGSWRPHGWLKAPLEFPQFHLALPSKSKSSSEHHLAWIESHFSKFDVWGGDLSSDDDDDTNLDSIAHCLEGVDIIKMRDTIFHLALSYWVGLSLSAAVLQNSFSHYRSSSSHYSSDGNSSTDKGHYPNTPDEGETLLDLLRLQLVKIYHLRRKLTSVEGLLRSIKASLLRHAKRLKQKRTPTGRKRRRLSSSPLDSPKRQGSALSGLQRAEKAASVVEFALLKLRVMDIAVFQSNEFIPIDALWTCLVDNATEDQAIRRSLESLLASSSKSIESIAPQQEGWFITGTRCIRVKHCLVEGLALLLNTEAGKGKVHQGGFSNCFRMCYSLVDLIPSLRIGYFSTNRHLSVGYLTLSSLLSFTSAYLRLLTIIIIQDPSIPCRMPSMSSSVDGLRAVGALLSHDASNGLFQSFLTMLTVSDTPQLACMLMEIVTVLAVREGGELNDQAVAASWSSLHSVYAHQTGGMTRYCTEPPYVIRCMAKRIENLIESYGTKLKSVFEFLRLSEKHSQERRSRSFYEICLLQHWGLITQSSDYVAHYYGPHFSSMIEELRVFVASLNLTKQNNEKHKKDSTTYTDIPSDEPRHPLPFLSAASLEDVFSHLLNMLVGALAICDPALHESSITSAGPYVHFHIILRLFRRLLEVYRDHFSVFPAKSSMDVYQASCSGLVAVVYQLNCCADWRSDQPFLTPEEKEAQVHDPGASTFLQALLSDMFSYMPVAVLNLCDFWERQSPQFHSRATRLRQAAEKSAQSIKNVATTHNWAPPTDNDASTDNDCITGIPSIPLPDKKANGEGTSSRRTHAEQQKKRPRSMTTMNYLSEDDQSDDDDDDYESDGSYGVAGDWVGGGGGGGGGSEDDSSSIESLSLH